MNKKPNLIIIPGLGDQVRLFSAFKPIWIMLGFKTYIHNFGWESDISYLSAIDKLVKFIDSLEGDVYIIGASAGGSSAVNALYLRPNKVPKIATISTPYHKFFPTKKQKLADSVYTLEANLKNDENGIKDNILSIFAQYDRIVPIKESVSDGVKTYQLNTRGHVLTIFYALSFKSRHIKKFLLNS
jgi:hypothetical protein